MRILKAVGFSALFSAISTCAHATEETLRFTPVTSADEMGQVLQADRFLRFDRPVLAGKTFRSLSQSSATSGALKRYSQGRLDSIVANQQPYEFSFRISPDFSQRNYKSDTLGITINGEVFDFTVNRLSEPSGVLELTNSYTYWLWPYVNSGWIDEVKAQHTLTIYSDKAFENEVMFGGYRSNDRGNRRDQVNFSIKSKNDGTDLTERILKIATDYRTRSYRVSASLEHKNYIGDDVVYTHANSAQVMYTTTLNEIEVSASASANDFSRNDYNYNSLSLAGAKVLESLGAVARAEYALRLDEQIRFPTNTLRRDHKVTLSLAKKLRVGDWAPSVSVFATRSHSNVSIYAYDRVGLSVSFDAI